MLFECLPYSIAFVLETAVRLPHMKEAPTTLILPKPLKDEFALGLIGRLCHINSINSFVGIMRNLLAHFGLKSEQGAYLEALALSAGMGLQDFVLAHTIAPAMLTQWNVVAGRLGGNGRFQLGDERNPLKLARKRAYFCPRCLEQQRHDLGFSFWHRAHQLPGIYWCPWHWTALLGANGGVMQSALPSLSYAEPGCVTAAEKDILNPTLYLFSNIMMDCLARPRRHSRSQLVARLRIRAIERGLNVDEKSSPGRRLSDLAGTTCPAWWLEDVFGWRSKEADCHFKPIDGALLAEPMDSMGARAYVLAIALLFAPNEWKNLGIEVWTRD